VGEAGGGAGEGGVHREWNVLSAKPQSFQKTLILYEGSNHGGDFGQSFGDGLRANHCDVDFLPRDNEWQADYDLVLAYGPFHRESSMLPAVRRLRALPAERRPVFAWWLTEGIPPPSMPAWLVECGARARLFFDRWNTPPLGHRLRTFGELRAAQRLGVLDMLVVTSASRANYLRGHGFQPIVVPLGYHPQYYGEDLGMTRDIDVCFIGNLNASRRRRLFERVARELRERGIAIAVYGSLYGRERTLLLNRSKILLNIMRAPQDFVGQRFLLGAANKALVVSEPINDSEPFVNRKHIVTAAVPRLAETIAHFICHEDERMALAEAAHCLATCELTIERMVGRILAQVPAARAARVAHAG
jgi:hypothetical protein